jgi:hypothetical protein
MADINDDDDNDAHTVKQWRLYGDIVVDSGFVDYDAVQIGNNNYMTQAQSL